MGDLFKLYTTIALLSMLVVGCAAWWLSAAPVRDELGTVPTWVLPASMPEPSVPALGAAETVFFYDPNCPACKMAQPVVDKLERQYPQYRWARVNVSYPRGMELAEQYFQHYNVPERDRGQIPVLFAGDRTFQGYPAIQKELPAYLQQVRLSRPQPRQAADSAAAAVAAIRRRFALLRVAPVVVAGLVDSINPCAIATLIFFLAYLAYAGRKPRELLAVGAAFTAGVFLTYLLIGLGLLRVLHSLPVTTTLGRWIYPLAGFVTLVLAAVSLSDYLKARRGQTAAITLQMPRRLKLWTHRVIRERMGPGSAISVGRLAAAAFVTALMVSALEFTCTSQVYLPTLMYMVQVEGHRLRAVALLVLYNLMFVAPLIALFMLAYYGVNSRTIAAFFVRKTAATKLAMALLFVGFSIYLFVVGARMF
jgi:hypothetical protein